MSGRHLVVRVIMSFPAWCLYLCSHWKPRLLVRFSFQRRGPLTVPPASAASTGTRTLDCGRDVVAKKKEVDESRGKFVLCNVIELVDTNTFVLYLSEWNKFQIWARVVTKDRLTKIFGFEPDCNCLRQASLHSSRYYSPYKHLFPKHFTAASCLDTLHI